MATAISALAGLGLAGILLYGRAPVLATEPTLNAVQAAETSGYRAALAALAGEASRLEVDGKFEASLGAWQCIARGSKDAGLAAHAEQRVEELSNRIAQGARLGQHQQSEAPKRQAVKTPASRLVQHQRKPMATPRTRSLDSKVSTPRRLNSVPVFRGAPEMPDVVIPHDVRQKF
jgi:hypothetical protein